MKAEDICLIAAIVGYLVFVKRMASTWAFQQDVVRFAQAKRLPKGIRGILLPDAFRFGVWMNRLRYIPLVTAALLSSMWVIPICLVAEALAKFAYYSYRVDKAIKPESLQEMQYALECKKMQCYIDGIKDVIIIEQLLSSLPVGGEYKVLYVKDMNGFHLVQVLNNTMLIDGIYYGEAPALLLNKWERMAAVSGHAETMDITKDIKI